MPLCLKVQCGWEANHRSSVALAMCHRLQWFIHLQAHGIKKGDEIALMLLVWYGTFACTIGQ